MARVKRGVTTHARHKKILNLAKGYKGRAKSCYRIALQRVEKHCNMLIGTEEIASAIFAVYG